MQFQDITSQEPDLSTLGEKNASLLKSIGEAQDVEALLSSLRLWDELRCRLSTHGSLVDLRFQQDTRDAESKQAKEAWDAASPRWTEMQVDVMRLLLSHPLRAEAEGKIGSQAFALWESEVLAFHPAIKDDLVTEARLSSEYTELLASAQLTFQGERHNLSTILKFRQDADRDVRHAAERTLWAWFEANEESLDRLFSELVTVRARMAQATGHRDYVDLGYKRMCRVDYDRADVERFRLAVQEHVVPLAHDLRRKQAKRLGVTPLMAWDGAVHDPQGSPAPAGDMAWMVERAQEMFDTMGPELGDFFRTMNEGEFLDLASREGKAGGGFCTSFPTHGMPFVYANFNGTRGDVEVLTHEIGHAFQAYMSRRQWPSDYHWPTYEGAEVHSMGLEFLTWPHMESLFGTEAERFRNVHLVESLVFIPYGTAVDHFQHLIYEQPEASPSERHAMWKRMEELYLPWMDWGDLSYPTKGGRWQHQRHIYLDPFYYIDYVLAQTCALQLLARSAQDPKGTLAAYVDLCRRGGSLPFQSLVRSAGLKSPFDPGCLKEVCEHARRML